MARQTDQNMNHRTSQIAEIVIGHRKTENAAHTPTPWTYSDVSGAGLEIRGPVYLSKGIELPRGLPEAPIKIFEFTAPQIVQIAAERWVQFEPEGWSEMQEANAAFIVKAVNNHDALVKAMEAACGYLLNAKIDLETGCTKATAIKTIEGGIKRIRETLSRVTAAR